MLLPSRQSLRLLIKPKSSKTIGLFLTAAAVIFSLASVLRYSAKASEFLTASSEAMALVKTVEKDVLNEIAPDSVYRFSMSVVGAASAYDLFELEIVADGLAATAILRSQLRNDSLQTYEQMLDEGAFITFWKSLRSLETAQLSDLSPHTEAFLLSLNKSGVVNYAALEAKQTAMREQSSEAAMAIAYRFTFQDGLHDYPNSFEVYAPDALEDSRYLQLKNLAVQFAKETFDLAE